MARVYIDTGNFDKVVDAVKQFGDGAEDVINDYLHNQGATVIKGNINKILPVSGRTWKGKKAAAKVAEPFRKRMYNLAVDIHAPGYYHYLYFPDDGANTIRHYGGQEFMRRGAEESTDEIVNEIIKKLLKDF